MKYLTLILVVLIFAVVVERVFMPETTDDMQHAAVTYGEEREKHVPPLPFRYDGCTLFPDKLPGLNLSEACLVHDIAYWHGGTPEERKEADRRLQEAAGTQGWFGQIMQYPVYIGVRVFGDSLLTKTFNAHWGFGHE